MIKSLLKGGIIAALSLNCYGISEDLLNAIEQVESGGKSNAIGDNGKAVGAYQIHPIMVKEVNRLLKSDKYRLEDRMNRAKSREMCRIYLDRAKKRADKIEGKNISEIDLSGCWNGGYNGYKMKSTINYRNKIKKVLDRLK